MTLGKTKAGPHCPGGKCGAGMPPPVLMVFLLSALLMSLNARAVTAVDPAHVNVNRTGVTTVFLTFQGTADQVAADAFWCRDITVPANTPVATDPCVPGTLLGRLPARNELSASSGTGGAANTTDIMTIPASVARRAYQGALAGKSSRFFYVRKFVDAEGREEFIAVECRLAGGGAGAPLSLTRVKLYFEAKDGPRPVYLLARGQRPPPISARIEYTGSGRLKGRWEVVKPGDSQPRIKDLLPEGSLPREERGGQRRYQLLGRFDIFLPPTGRVTLPGPDPERIPTQADGPYKILLRIEASRAPASVSDTTTGVVHSGGVAGFPMPVLRYFVGNNDALVAIKDALSHERLSLVYPLDGAVVRSQPVSLNWKAVKEPDFYLLEVEREGQRIFSAVVNHGVSSYTLPSFISARPGSLRWRVSALNAQGDMHARSPWWSLKITTDKAEGGQ